MLTLYLLSYYTCFVLFPYDTWAIVKEASSLIKIIIIIVTVISDIVYFSILLVQGNSSVGKRHV